MSASFEWSLEAPSHWRAVKQFAVGGNQPQFVSAEQDPDRIVCRYFMDDAAKVTHAHVRLGLKAQGPPGKAHGGSTAALLDEMMGMAAWQTGLNVVAKEIQIRYFKPTPLWEELVARAWVERVEDERAATVCSELVSVDGTVFVRGTGTFIHIGVDKYKGLVEQATAARERLARGEE